MDLPLDAFSNGSYSFERFLSDQAKFYCLYNFCSVDRMKTVNKTRGFLDWKIKYDDVTLSKAWPLIKSVFTTIDELMDVQTLEELVARCPALSLSSCESMVGTKPSTFTGQRFFTKPSVGTSEWVDAIPEQTGQAETNAQAIQLTVWSALCTYRRTRKASMAILSENVRVHEKMVKDKRALDNAGEHSLGLLTKSKTSKATEIAGQVMFYDMVRDRKQATAHWSPYDQSMVGNSQVPHLLILVLIVLHRCMDQFCIPEVMGAHIKMGCIEEVAVPDLTHDLAELFAVYKVDCRDVIMCTRRK